MPPARRRGVSLAREVAQVLCVLAVVNGAWLCAFARLAPLAPDAFIATSLDLLNTALVPMLLTMAVVALLAGLLRRTLGLWLLTITLAMAAWQAAALLAGTAPRRSERPSERVVRVVTLNAFHANPAPARLRAVIEAAAPDIVLLQEAEGSAGRAMLHALPAYHRVLSCLTPPCSLTILSRWPVRGLPKPMPPAHDLPDVLFAQVSLPARKETTQEQGQGPGRTLDLVAVHMPRGYRPVAGRFRRMLIDALQREGVPTIVAGDFNLPSGAAALGELVRETGLRRAERWIATYPANTVLPAFAAIDHIFVYRSFAVRGCHRLPFAGSDHFGIACDVVVPAP